MIKRHFWKVNWLLYKIYLNQDYIPEFTDDQKAFLKGKLVIVQNLPKSRLPEFTDDQKVFLKGKLIDFVWWIDQYFLWLIYDNF